MVESYEYRVMMSNPVRGPILWHDNLVDLAEAEELARIEREDYPHHEVWVERRTISDWERLG